MTWQRHCARWFCAALFASALCVPLKGWPQPPTSPQTRVSAISDSIEQGLARGRTEAWAAELRGIIAEVEARHDERTAMTAWRVLASVRFQASDTPGRVVALEKALDHARSLGDADAQCDLLDRLANAQQLMLRREESMATVRELRAVAARIGSDRWRAAADFREAMTLIYSGGLARAESLLHAALPVLEEARVGKDEAVVLQFLAIAAVERGHPDEARRYFDRAIARTRQIGSDELLFALFSNLAAFEMREQFDARAIRALESADSVVQRTGNQRRRAFLMLNRAHILIRMQRLTEAVAQVDSSAAIAKRLNLPDVRFGSLLVGGWALSNLAQYAESNRRLRQAIEERGDILGVLNAASTLVDNLVVLDSLDAALEVVNANVPIADKASLERATYLRLRGGDVELLLGNPEAADAFYSAAYAKIHHLEFQIFRPELLVGRARAARALGRFDEAARLAEAAGESWRDSRRRSGTTETRERLSYVGAEIGGVITAGLDTHATEAELRAVFDRAEPFKAQTFIELLTGHPADSLDAGASSATVETLQRDVLEPGELLLDFRLSESGSFVFAITRDHVRFAPIAERGNRLSSRVREWRSLVEEDATGSEAEGPATRALAELLLGGVRNDVAAARTIIVSPERALHLAPFALLIRALEGDQARLPAIAMVPSATLLAMTRRVPDAQGGGVFVAAAGKESEDPGAPLLPGAHAETVWLRDRFEHVITLESGAPTGPVAWSDGAVLHLAAHMRQDDGAPWKSAVELSLDGPDGPRELRADQVAQMRLPARLVMLASCTSLGETISAGEGVAGMATAFLIAGVPTVVATLWPVDDRATVIFTHAFYEGLARGLDAGEAVREAQQALAHHREFHAPRFWAGYVVVGNPATRLALAARPRPMSWAISGLLVLGWL